MPSSTLRKSPSTINKNLSRPSLIDTMLLTSTPLRRSPGVVSSTTISTRSAINSVLKEKNPTYEDMQLLNMTKHVSKTNKQNDKRLTNKKLKKRSKGRRTLIDDNETENDVEIKLRSKSSPNKRKTIISKQVQLEEPISKKLRRTAALNKKKIPIGKISAASSDGCTTVDEENEETHLIEQSKLYIEGTGIRTNYQNITEHNRRIGEKIESVRWHRAVPSALPSPILTRSNTEKQNGLVAQTANSSPVKMKTASRITFALPCQGTSPMSTNHPPSPQMPPTTTTTTSIDTQTEDFSPIIVHEKQCQTQLIDTVNQLVQTEMPNDQLVSGDSRSSSNFLSEQHLVCRDLTVCSCVEQLVKTRQFLVDASVKLQLPTMNRSTTKASKQTMTAEESSASNMVLAKSSLKPDQQMIFERFISQFNVRYSNSVDETTTHLITDSLDENVPFVCPLTLKVIQATARHLPIISIQWLVASLTHQIMVPSQIYETFLGDPTYGYHGGFLRSRIPRSQGLLHGITFLLECAEQHGCQAVLADNRALRELIFLCGGTISDQTSEIHSSTLIVLCDEVKQKDHRCAAYVKPEWLLASIAQYNLQPFQLFSS